MVSIRAPLVLVIVDRYNNTTMKLTKVRGFPQISRFFSAAGLWTSLAALLFLNISLKATISPAYSDAIISIFTHPHTPQPHIALAKLLRQEQRQLAATQELLVAVELAAQRGASLNVLGATTDPTTLLEQWRTESERLAQQYRFWRIAAEDKPDYRDAQLAAAMLAFQQSDMAEAERFAKNALAIDPNNTQAQQLLKIIK